jgi:TRAP-type mannitol/chloroaromatic compound transport system substrate-binding protein
VRVLPALPGVLSLSDVCAEWRQAAQDRKMGFYKVRARCWLIKLKPDDRSLEKLRTHAMQA